MLNVEQMQKDKKVINITYFRFFHIIILLFFCSRQLIKSKCYLMLLWQEFAIKMIMNQYMLGESRDQLTQLISTKMLFELNASFRQVKLKKVKDVSCLEVFQHTLYVGTNESKVVVYEIYKGKSQEHTLELVNERSFYPHCTSVHFIAASPLFLIVVPLEQQQLIRIWNRQTLQILHGYKGHAKQITSVIFLKDNNHIASISYDGTSRIWKISQNFEFDMEVRKYANKYPLLALVEIDSENVVFGGDDCFITIWNWNKDVVRHKCFAHPGSITSLFISQPNFLYSIGGDSKIRAWRIQETQFQKTAVNINQMINDEVVLTQKRLHLYPIKQFNESITQIVFTIHITNFDILVIDSKGNTFFINRNLQVSSSQLRMQYTESIRSAKLWQNRLLVVSHRKGKGEMKQIAGDFEDMMNKTLSRVRITFPTTTNIEVRTKHSIALQNQSLEKIADN